MIYTKQAAKRDGYTYEGQIYGIRVWIRMKESEVAAGYAEVADVACKFKPFELVLPLFDWVYMTWKQAMHPRHGFVWPILVNERPI